MANKEKGLLREIDGIKGEFSNIKNQLYAEKEKSDHILRDLNGIKETLNQSQQREQSYKQTIERANSEVESVKNQLNQANNYIQTHENHLRDLQRENDAIKNSNLDLKHQLEQSKIQANYSQQQISYQPPPPQFRPPPQYDYPQYQQPPQAQYYPPNKPQENAYPSQSSYQAPSFEVSTPPRSKAWEPEPVEQNYNSQFQQPISTHSPPKEEYRPTLPSRNQYSEKPGAHSYESQPLDHQTPTPSFVDNQASSKIQTQSTMGALLTWEEEEKNPQNLNQLPQQEIRQKQPTYHKQTPPRNMGRGQQEQTAQW